MSRTILALALMSTPASASYDRIAGYMPETDVVPHSKIDLDIAEIAAASSAGDLDEAYRVYQFGGGGLCSATDIQTTDESNSCFGHTQSDSKGNSVKGSGSIRTVKGFATSGEAKMSAEKWWVIYKNYWNDPNYSDTFVREAAENSIAGLDMSDTMRGELFKKGAAYQSVWMYVLHEYEDAIADCLSGNIFDNDASNSAGDSPHAWDEGWAFYAGSLEGEDGSGSGSSLYHLADKRSADFGTGMYGTSGTSHVNVHSLEAAELGRDKILLGDCYSVKQEYDIIVDQMTVPLIQATLKYAFKSDPSNAQGSCTTGQCDKEWAEGWAFAAAALPRLHYCDTNVADFVRANLDVRLSSPVPDGWQLLKTHVESTYACLGITCADVGSFQNSAGIYSGMEACVDAPSASGGGGSSSSKKSTKIDEVPIIIIAIVAAVFLLATGLFFMKWRATEAKLEKAMVGSPLRKDLEM